MILIDLVHYETEKQNILIRIISLPSVSEYILNGILLLMVNKGKYWQNFGQNYFLEI